MEEGENDIKYRYKPETEATLRQFLKYANSGSPSAYRVRYTYAFELTEEQKTAVHHLVVGGLTFEDAVNQVAT